MPKLKISSCTVQQLDGEDIIIEVENLKKSEDLIDEVCKQIGIEEKIYFGLKYKYPKDDKDYWFDINKPLRKQLKYASNKLKFTVQFFPKSLQSLTNEITRYQFVLQIREYLLTGIWSCTIPTQALLASYIVQSEFGNYDATSHDSTYLNELQFIPDQAGEFLNHVSKFHQKHKDLNPLDVDWLYLETARKTPLYGMEVFDIMDSDKNTMKLGVNIDGMNILHMNTKLHTFLWPTVLKCRFKNNEIIVQLQGTKEIVSVGFVAASTYDAKRIMKCCNVYKHFATHGKRLVVKTPKKNEEVVDNSLSKCTHSSADDFRRVDSRRFSKRFVKVKESTRLDLSDDDDDDDEEQTIKPNENGDTNGKENLSNLIPAITETAPSEHSLTSEHSLNRSSNGASPKHETKENEENKENEAASPVEGGKATDSTDAPKPNEQIEIIEFVEIEYTKDAVTVNDDGTTNDNPNDGGNLNETVTSKIVEIQIVTSTEESVEVRSPCPEKEELPEKNTTVKNDQEAILVYGEESLDEVESSLKSNTSLMEEIEKELNDSYEILINSEEERG